MFNFDDFRVKDLDELVPLVKSEESGFDIKRLKSAFFRVSKNAYVSANYDKKSDEVQITVKNPVYKVNKSFGGKNPVEFESVDLNALVENFIVFDYLVSKKSIFGKRNPDSVQTHLILSNIESALAGKPVQGVVEQMVSEEDYQKAIARAKKAFEKDQQSTIESQTPVYDS